ncbi:Na+/H+ antiporter subunit D [Paenibacillus sp. IB182496]|uniref:Na+/H+ antiporter subunit D n=1 Tax=Paenibacillus sabuli TaxID=2772509 RepID=A0A927BRI5_9BACL|nr:Na+/H+ antiporter subunit D [Paenibacillus sabuli]MBD2844581.1 Na+/H+ antiporter subunit D [Paenibacillus sabuli]
MSNLVIMPLLVPLVTAVLLIFFHKRLRAQRILGAVSALINIAVALGLVLHVRGNGIATLQLGGWAPPQGIVFVADMFAALLVLTTAIVGACCLFFAFFTIGEPRERHYFYPFFHFLLVGVIGSFLTGDIFNLFVCFEVMLIASYALIVLGGTKRQLRESIKYLLINIVSSALFVTAVAYLYGTLGTLNMADLSMRVAEAGQDGLLTLLSVLLLLVFGLKAGLLLFFWLPGSYSAPPPAVAAVFAGLLTKVGVYAIIRVFTLIFYHDQAVTHVLIGVLAAITMSAGVIGAIAYRDVHRILIYNIVAAVGFMAFGLAVASREALEGATFYLLHDMLVKALLFLLGGALIAGAGTSRLAEMGGLIRRFPLLGWLLLVAALALVGVPPTSGFVGKLLIVQGGLAEGWYWITGISLASSLLMLYSMMKLFMAAFWGEEPLHRPPSASRVPTGVYWPIGALTVLVLALGVGAQWAMPYVAMAADALTDPQIYIDAVMKE